MRDGAFRALQIIAGFVLKRQGFLDAVLDGVTREQGPVEVQPHCGGADVGPHGGGTAAVLVAQQGVATHQVKRWFFASPCAGCFKHGHIQRGLGLADAGVRIDRLLNPGIHVRGRRCLEHDGQCQRFGLGVAFAHQLVQRNLLDAQVILCRQLLGGDQVKAGLRFTRVSDGRGAHFKIALG